jgi:hypothetical protein
MRDDETIREYVEATLPSDQHLRQSCRSLDIPYDREQIVRERCWTVFQMQRHRARQQQETGGGAGSQT